MRFVLTVGAALLPAASLAQSLPQPQVVTQTANDNSARAASTAYVDRAAQAVLQSLSGGIATNATAILTEQKRALAVEAALAPLSAITEETTRAQGAERTNATAISIETSRAQSAEALLAPLASPTLTGSPKAPTAAAGTSTTQIATTAFTSAAVFAETSRAKAAEGLLAPLASPAFTGTVTVPSLAVTGTASTGVISNMSVAPQGGSPRSLASLIADRANVMNFGAAADDATDNTNAVKAAIAAGVASGRPVVFPNTGSGSYRIGPGVVWDGVSVQTDYGVQLKNLDGSQYSGAFASFSPFSVNLNPSAAGKRLDRPGFINHYSNVYQTRSDDHALEIFQTYAGSAGGARNPYANTGANIHVYKDYGRDGASSGTTVLVGGHINMFSGGNGTGFNSTGTFTNGSPTISNVPSAYFTQLSYPAKVTSATSGIPQDTYVVASNSSAGTVTLSNAFTGTTTSNVTFNTVVGRSEITPLSFGANLSNTVTMPGANYYYDFGMSCPTGATTADRPGYCSGLTSIVQNWAPLGAFDSGHNGVFGGSIATVPGNGAYDSQNRAGQRLYPGDAGLAIVGWSGVVGTATDGRNANATPGWNVGLQIGGVGGSVWMPSTSRSFIGTGVLVQDWSTGIKITGRHPRATGAPLAIDPFQGETLIGTLTTGGGQMSIGNTGAASGTNLVLQEAGVSGSTRAANAYGTGWVMGQDLAGSGSRVFSLLNVGSGSSAFTVDTTNRFGIGTSTPLAPLAVTGASQTADNVASGGSNAMAQFTTGTGGAGDNKLAIGILDGAYSWIQALQPAVAYRGLILQPKGGSVGIGTTTPGALLDVAGTMRGQMLTLSAAPTTSNIPASYWTVVKRSDDASVKICANDAGTIKCVAMQ